MYFIIKHLSEKYQKEEIELQNSIKPISREDNIKTNYDSTPKNIQKVTKNHSSIDQNGISEKYGALRAISIIYKILSVICSIISISILIVFPGETSLKLTILFAAFITVIFLFSMGEGIDVFVDIEQNLRYNNTLMEKYLEK